MWSPSTTNLRIGQIQCLHGTNPVIPYIWVNTPDGFTGCHVGLRRKRQCLSGSKSTALIEKYLSISGFSAKTKCQSSALLQAGSKLKCRSVWAMAIPLVAFR